MSGWHPADLALTPAHESALLTVDQSEPELGETFNVWLYDPATDTGFNIDPRAFGGRMISSRVRIVHGFRACCQSSVLRSDDRRGALQPTSSAGAWT